MCDPRREEEAERVGWPQPSGQEGKTAALDAARGDPISDSGERLVRLALGKRTSPEVKTSRAVVACITAAKAGDSNAAQAPGAASEFDRGREPKRRLDTDGEAESCPSGSAKAEDPPPASDDAQDAPPERREAATQVSPATLVAPLGSIAASSGVAAKPRKKKAKTKEVVAPASSATGAKPKEVSPAVKGEGVSTGGGKLPTAAEAGLPRRKKVPCPVFGCTRKHAADQCSTFRDIFYLF
jgi:hypothetical protein